MEKLKKHIHDDSNGLDYVLVGDYYIPDLRLPEESRPIGRWGRMHREYLQEYILVKEGHFKIVRIGNAIRISKRSFDEWLDSLDL